MNCEKRNHKVGLINPHVPTHSLLPSPLPRFPSPLRCRSSAPPRAVCGPTLPEATSHCQVTSLPQPPFLPPPPSPCPLPVVSGLTIQPHVSLFHTQISSRRKAKVWITAQRWAWAQRAWPSPSAPQGCSGCSTHYRTAAVAFCSECGHLSQSVGSVYQPARALHCLGEVSHESSKHCQLTLELSTSQQHLTCIC